MPRSRCKPGKFMNFNIKKASNNDLERIHKYLNYFFDLGLEGISLRKNAITEEAVNDFIPDEHSLNDKLCLIALKDIEVIGCLTFARYTKLEYRHGGRFGMTVHPDFWRQGIGSSFLSDMEKWCVRHDFLKIELEVWSNNQDAIRLYEKHDYVLEGKRKGSIIRNSNVYDLILMGKCIGQPDVA